MGRSVFSSLIAFVFYNRLLVVVTGHGMLIDPPGRSTAWRFGFNTSINYGDNELFCGGFVRQWLVNGGKCGICGDAFDAQRIHELPDGKFAKNLVITRKYTRGSIFTATAQLSANHKGHFVFKICPATTKTVEVTQDCLDDNVLEVVNSIDKYKYELPSDKSGNFSIDLKLPDDLVCERCVLQWNYIAGNNWGKCKNGTAKVGCGNQENFRNCADIQITAHENDIDGIVPNDLEKGLSSSTPQYNSTDSLNEDKSTKFQSTIKNILTSTSCPKTSNEAKDKVTLRPTFKPKERTVNIRTNTPNYDVYSTEMSSSSAATRSSTNNSNSGKKCVAIGAFARMPQMSSWCEVMCKTTVCPESHCYCQ